LKTLILNEEFSLQFPHDVTGHCDIIYDVEIQTSNVNDFLVDVKGKAVTIVTQHNHCFRWNEDPYSALLSDYVFDPPDWWPKKEFEVKERLPWIDCIKAFFKGEPLTYKKIETVYDDQVKLEGYYSFTIPVTQIKVIKDQ
jgi:hypothetical protein